MRQSINSLVIQLCILMAGFTSLKTIVPTPTGLGLLCKQEATNASLRIASTGQPEIELTRVKATVIKARQSTLTAEIISGSQRGLPIYP
jgi:hypothetical protein